MTRIRWLVATPGESMRDKFEAALLCINEAFFRGGVLWSKKAFWYGAHGLGKWPEKNGTKIGEDGTESV